jgi:hypothetical protein
VIGSRRLAELDADEVHDAWLQAVVVLADGFGPLLQRAVARRREADQAQGQRAAGRRT